MVYYISYAFQNRVGVIKFGAVTIDTSLPIESSDIQTLRERIADTSEEFKADDIIILNMIRLENR